MQLLYSFVVATFTSHYEFFSEAYCCCCCLNTVGSKRKVMNYNILITIPLTILYINNIRAYLKGSPESVTNHIIHGRHNVRTFVWLLLKEDLFCPALPPQVPSSRHFLFNFLFIWAEKDRFRRCTTLATFICFGLIRPLAVGLSTYRIREIIASCWVLFENLVYIYIIYIYI